LRGTGEPTLTIRGVVTIRLEMRPYMKYWPEKARWLAALKQAISWLVSRSFIL